MTWRGMKRDDPSSWTFLPGLTFTLNEIVDDSGLSSEVVTSVLRAFMVPTDDRNGTFNSLGDFNGASAFPIISHPDGSLVCLQIYTLYEALYDSPFYWMIADKSYAAIAQEHRGKFTEQFATQRLKAVFGEKHVYSNVNLIGAKGQRIGEIDVLVIFGDRAIVVQCKSKRLTLEARKGNDLQLQADFKLAVQAAYDQALICAKAIESDTTKFDGLTGKNAILPQLKEIYICTLVSDHYPALAVQGRELLNYELSGSIQPPLVADVFFLDVLAEFLSSPLRFLSYVNLRVALHEKLSSINEINILGYHLKQNLWFEKDVNMVMVADDYGMDLDVAMMVRREGIQGLGTPLGILTRMDKMLAGRMIRSIENAEDSSLIDFGLLLLSVSEDALSALSNGIEQITAQTKRDGKVHDLTMGFEGNEAGLTVHCSNDENSVAATRLAQHCRRRKYVTRAPQWFGFCARLDDGMPKFGLKLESPWEFDAELEIETEGMSKSSSAIYSGGKFKAKKVGRNDECPCGSGKKCKKCCQK